MTSTQASAAPFFSPGSPSTPIPDVSTRPATGHGRRNLVIGLASIAVAAVAFGGIQYARSASTSVAVTPVSHLAAAVPVWDAYEPGGSVYAEQVPAQASTSDVSAFVPGGSVYGQQVPLGAVAGDQSALQPGGSVYEQQVP
jgi:hypothetical protein